MAIGLALLGAIISGFGFALGYGLAVASARTVAAKLSTVDTRIARRWFSRKAREAAKAAVEAHRRRIEEYKSARWSVLWLRLFAVIFVIATGGFGLIGLLIGYALSQSRQKDRAARQEGTATQPLELPYEGG